MKTEAQVKQILAQQTGIAQHVYDAVPIQRQWTSKQILGEMKRNNHAIDLRRLEGCLSSLVDSKLIKHTGEFYQRCATRTAVTLKSGDWTDDLPSFDNLEETTVANRKPREPIAIVGDLTADMHGIIKRMTNLAEKFEVAALELQEYTEQSKAETEELRELQRLLAKFGGKS